MQHTPLYSFILLSFFIWNSASANVTTMGADISYTCMDPNNNGENQYEFVVNLYYLCEPEVTPCPGGELQLEVSSESCSENFTFQIPRMNLDGIEVTPLCVAYTDSSTCNDNRYPGVVQFQYSNIDSPFGPLVLPCQANDWVVSLTDVARNETITNLQDPENHALYIEATINNEGGICNNSPQFGPITDPYTIPTIAPLAVPYYCLGLEAVFDQGVFDPNGDELSFELVQPRGEGGVKIPYVDGLDVGNPMSNTDFDVGLVTNPDKVIFTANEAQSAVISVVISDKGSGGTKLGSVMRDLQFIVIDCSNNQVEAAEDTNKFMEVCPNELVRFEIVITDEDEDDLLHIDTEMLDFLFGSTLTNTTGSSPLTAVFEWTPSVEDLGVHNILFNIRDDACPAFSQLTQNYQIKVSQDLEVPTTEYIYCATEPLEMMEINIGGCGPFIFTPEPSEVIEENGRIVGIIPNLEVNDYVISNFEDDFEEIHIEYISGFVVNLTSDRDILCQEESTDLSLNFAEEQPSCEVVFLEQTENGGEQNCNTCPNISPEETTLYTAIISCENGCEKREEVLITVEDDPTLSLMTSNLTLTSNGSIATVTAEGDFEEIEWDTGEMSTSIEVLIEALVSVEATAYSANGCSTTEAITLVFNCGDINMPTAFSPNGDNINDEFGIAIPVENLTIFSIYNRWGKPVFTTSNAADKWDGNFNFRPQPIGTYVYYIEANCRGEKVVNQGYVTLIR